MKSMLFCLMLTCALYAQDKPKPEQKPEVKPPAKTEEVKFTAEEKLELYPFQVDFLTAKNQEGAAKDEYDAAQQKTAAAAQAFGNKVSELFKKHNITFETHVLCGGPQPNTLCADAPTHDLVIKAIPKPPKMENAKAPELPKDIDVKPEKKQ